MKKLWLLYVISSIWMTSNTFSQEVVQKTFCMSTVGYKSTPDDLRQELLLNAKRLAIAEIFGELVGSYTKVENFVLTEDKVSILSAGFIRTKGIPVYKNGENFGEACVSIEAYATEEDKRRLQPVKISKKTCLADPKLTTAQLVTTTKEQAILSALINYERKLEGVPSKSLLPLVHKLDYLEAGFIPETETYCAKLEGWIFPMEVIAQTQDISKETKKSIIFVDDYNDPSPQFHISGSVNYKISDGFLTLTDGWHYIYYDNTINASNYTIEARIKSERGDGYGMFWKSNCSSSKVKGYGFQYQTDWNKIIMMEYPNLETWWHEIGATTSRDWHTIKVVISGNMVELYLNDTQIYSFTDTKSTGKSFGFRNWRGVTYIDYVKVY